MIAIGPRHIGHGSPCFLIAEIGLNHNGDMELARQAIKAAAHAGANAVKFQNYHTEDFIRDPSVTYTYQVQGKPVVETQYDMFKRYELRQEQLAFLAEQCAANDVVFTSTPTSRRGIADIVALGASVLKNGSDFLGNLPLIRDMAKTGLPTILSTGLATLGDIDDAVRAYRAAGGEQLILLHCVSSYPAPMEDLHLRNIEGLAKSFDCLVGFSDHTEGTVAAVGAVALGACIIEKHFTLDRALPGPDHWFSSDPSEFANLVKAVRDLEAALAPAPIGPSGQVGNAVDFRLSCVAAVDLADGHVLGSADIAFSRPGIGMSPKQADWLVGIRLTRDVRAGHAFTASDFR